MSLLQNSNAISSGSYDINNSLRFRSSASAYLNRTLSAGNRKTWTWSAWVKRGALGTSQFLFTCDNGSSDAVDNYLYINSSDKLEFAGFTTTFRNTTSVYRDPSAWYHIVLTLDTTQATAANRIKLYVNGSQITAFDNNANPNQNDDLAINQAAAHYIGIRQNATLPFDGYMADTYFIDGQALTPSSFGETDTTTGVWKPKAYTGTYGTNGFYLKFSDIATTSGSNAGLGKDFSGNGNYWATNNISITAGTTYDAMTDVPTNTSATVANYATWNPTIGFDGTYLNTIMSNGNLTTTDAGSASYNAGTSATIGVTSGKWYWENTIGSGFPLRTCTGISFLSNSSPAWYGVTYDPYVSSGAIRSFVNGTPTSIQTSVGTVVAGDIVAIALDADAQTVKWYKNNVQIGTTLTYTSYLPTGYSFIYPGFWTPNQSTASISTTFGQRPFTYTPPTGYKALNTYNLPDSTIKKGNTVMDATTYTGTGSSQTVVNAGAFKPDLVWIKQRSSTEWNILADSIRGTNKQLFSNSTNAEQTNATFLTAFASNGFTVDTSTGTNGSGSTYVGWQWQAGQGSTSSNTSGSITSTVSVNTTAGFSVVTWTGNGTAGATVGHGLGVTPAFVIIKNRTATAGEQWLVWHKSISQAIHTSSLVTLNGYTGALLLNGTNASFTYGFDAQINGSTNGMLAYCWAAIPGYSAFGSYTGNGSTDGPFVFTNLKPRFIMIKRTDSTSNWTILDTAREGYNVDNDPLYPNLSDAEGTTDLADILSNGFKLRSTDASVNANAGTYIYACFSSNPFKNSTAV